MSLLADLTATSHPRATAAVLQTAIDDAATLGGGRITVPPGTWTITTVELRSGITLHLERGAVLRAHADLADYQAVAPSAHTQRHHLIRAEDCDDIALTGDGTIDGNGLAFWEEPLRDLQARGIDISADLARMPSYWPPDGPFWRGWKPRISPLIELRRCRDVVLRDLTIKDSPGWTIHPFCCDRVRIESVDILNHLYGPNTDGIDVNGCRDVWITGCRIVGCDDNIILKATRDSRRCERIVVSDCNLMSNCAALGLGAETTMGIADVSMTNCVVEQALRMVQFEMWEEGTIENVVISNLSGSTMTPADVPMEKVIYLDIQRHRRPADCVPGHLRGVVLSGITARTRGRCVLTAMDGGMIEDVVIRDVLLDYPDGIESASQLSTTCRCGQNSNSNPAAQAADAVLVCDNVRGLRVHDLAARMPAAGGGVPAMHAIWARNTEALIDCPHLAPNGPHPAVVEVDCALDLRTLGNWQGR
jgi:hypothetical protein